MKWRRFFFFNVSGAVLWAVVITLVGYYFGQGRETMSSYFKYVDETIMICHGAPFDEDYYIFGEFDAAEAFDHIKAPICSALPR
jgi:hypothetical protein